MIRALREGCAPTCELSGGYCHASAGAIATHLVRQDTEETQSGTVGENSSQVSISHYGLDTKMGSGDALPGLVRDLSAILDNIPRSRSVTAPITVWKSSIAQAIQPCGKAFGVVSDIYFNF